MRAVPDRRTGAVTLWIVLIAVGGMFFLTGFELDNSVGIWFPKDDPALADYERFLDVFGAWEWTLLTLESGAEGETAPPDLPALNARLRTLDSVRQVLGPVPNPPGSAFEGTTLLLETANPIHRGDDFRARMLAGIDAAVASDTAITGHTVAGTSVINVALNRSAKRDMLVFFNLVFLLLIVIARRLLRAWRDVAIILTIVIGAVAGTLGLVAATGVRFNILTVMMPTVLVALSVADLVHLIHAFRRSRLNGRDAETAAAAALREVRLPALGTTVTTIAGFLSLAPSDMPPVRDLALFSAFGIALAWIGAVTVAPGLLAGAWRNRLPPESGTSWIARGLDRWVELLPGRIRPVLAGLGLSLLLLVGLGRLHTDTNYAAFFRSGSTVDRAYDAVLEAGLPQSSFQILIDAGDDAAATRGTLPGFESALFALPGVRSTLSPVSPFAPQGMISADGGAFRVVLFTDFLGNRQVGELRDRVHALADDHLPGAGVVVTGSPVLWERMDASIVRTQRTSLILVAVTVFVLLLALFRSFRYALLGWLASVLPVALILGVMGLLGVTVNLATALIAGIAIGIAVDDVIHFVLAVRRERERVSHGDAIRRVTTRIGERLVITSLILAGSFAVMALSDFTPTAEFGVFTALTILIALVLDLTVLPLALLGRRARVHTPVSGEPRRAPATGSVADPAPARPIR